MNHPFENDAFERQRFARNNKRKDLAAEWRRLVEKLTGGLPTYAERGKGGRPRKHAVSPQRHPQAR